MLSKFVNSMKKSGIITLLPAVAPSVCLIRELEALELELQVAVSKLVWVLGTKCKSSARATDVCVCVCAWVQCLI